MGALTLSGIVAPMTIGSAMNGPAFLAYVTQQLVPMLIPGDAVILDMCGRPHGSKRILRRRSVQGRVLTCVRPLKRGRLYAAGPYGSRRIGATSTSRARIGARP